MSSLAPLKRASIALTLSRRRWWRASPEKRAPMIRPHELDRQLRPDNAGAERQHVHVVVLHALVRRVGVVTHGRADARHLVRGDRRADAAAAEDDPSLGRAVDNAQADGFGEIRIIDRLLVKRALVDHLVAQAQQLVHDRPLDRESAVIRTDRYAHPYAFTPLARSTTASVRAATFSAVKPSFSMTVGPGAEAPKRPSMPIASPSSPTQRCHPSVTPASTETRARTDGGSTSSR